MCTYTSRTGQGPEEPLIALVQLGGHLVVMSFWWAPPIAIWTKSLEGFFFFQEKSISIATGKNKMLSQVKPVMFAVLQGLSVRNATRQCLIPPDLSDKESHQFKGFGQQTFSGGNWNLIKLEEWVGIDLIKAILEVTE